ncbi:MAG TPA: hypothetical protein VF625_06585 [Longimicrobium sp.]|jgi:hypothetical protein
MKRFVLCVLLAASAGLSACESGSPTAPAQPVTMMEQPIDEPFYPIDPEPIDTFPADTTTYPPYVPPTYEYRIVAVLYRSGGDMKASTELQRGYNGGNWVRVTASNLSVYCYVNGSYRDGETEYNASYTHITFGVSYQYGRQITCNHSANSGSYYASTSYTM